MQGQVYKIHSDFYYVKSIDFEFECKLKDTLKKQKENVVVGDYVELSGDNRFISSVLNRKSILFRPKVANIDLAIIISSFHEPELDFIQLNRYLTYLNYYKIDCVLCFNKEDLENKVSLTENAIKSIYKNLVKKIFFISAKNKTGITPLVSYIKGMTVALCGQSGVGKSTLINVLNPDMSLKTGGVSNKTKRGVHTTRHVEIIDCKDFRIIDTPGFSNLKFDFILPDELINYFPDIAIYSKECKYSNCLHDNINNETCSVVKNLDKINEMRYKSYLAFLEECKSYKKEISNKSIKTEEFKKLKGSKTVAKISKEKRILSRNTDKQRIKNYDDNQ